MAAAYQPVESEPGSRRIGDRYEVLAMVGRGGMGRVYRVHDGVTDRVVALKWLDANGSEDRRRRNTELFEREFHTLMQLAHPRVVQAYDYGIHDGNPYYTMELLDGGDLRQLAPMPWKEVCSVAYDVCSALSLLHSRRLLHLDITPANIHRTADGEAKIIDFGLLAPIGPKAFVAGTPSFVAPEAIGKVTLDARADLFSLGATLYYALTGRAAYPAARLQDLERSWRTSPPVPALLVKDVPPALEGLILSLIRLDPASRPKTAAEVMERLLPMLEGSAHARTSIQHAYLSTPLLVGRTRIVERIRKRLSTSRDGLGIGFVFSGPAGIGRSRMLDAFVLEAKLVGLTTLRAGSRDGAGRPFGVATALAHQLHENFPDESAEVASRLPDGSILVKAIGQQCSSESRNTAAAPPSLADITDSGLDRGRLQSALGSWFAEFAKKRPLAVAIDDLHQVDEPSAALFATLATDGGEHPIAYAATIDTSASAAAPHAVDVLRARTESIELAPLREEEITNLLASVFGDVPNLQLLSRRIYHLCGGHPRDCMAVLNQLVDEGAITYSDGTWWLPETFDEGQLPRNMEEALARRASVLSPLAKRIAALLGLGLLGRLSRTELLLLDGVTARELDRALAELLAAQLVVGDTAAYALCHDGFARLILSNLDEDERRARHGELALIFGRSDVEPIAVAYHLLSSSEAERGLDLILEAAPNAIAWEKILDRSLLRIGVDDVARTLELAVAEAERFGRSARVLLMLKERLAHMSTMGDDPVYYYRVAPACLEQCKRDSGFHDFHALDPALPVEARARQALAAAFQRYNATPEAERVLSPPEAIQGLVRWVVIGLPVASRIGDLAMVAALPPLLEPFAPENPLVDVIAENARATRLYRCEARWQEARKLWREVLQRLEASDAFDMVFATKVRTAIGSTLAGIEASLGIPSSLVERLESGDHDPLQLAQLVSIRRVGALYQGDWEAAERHRRRAEQVRLRTRSHQPISTLIVELVAHAAARDLTGVKQVRAAIHAMAEKYPGWIPLRHFADACYHRLRDDREEALAAADAAIEHAALQSPWLAVPWAVVVKVEILVELGRPHDALACGEPALARYRAAGVHHVARDLARALALADAKLNRFEAAFGRVETVISEQKELGIVGLQLGLSYETCARIAIWAGDTEQFETYAALTAECYRPFESSVLGALYERLREEARQSELAAARQNTRGQPPNTSPSQFVTRVASVLADCRDAQERAVSALQLLCEGGDSRRGHLFLLTERGLEMAASNAAEDALPGASEFAQDFIQHELADGETSVLTSCRTDCEETHVTTSAWAAPDGTEYRALLLSGPRAGQMCVAGVVLLNCEPSSVPFGLASALASWLVTRGDARAAVLP